MPKGRSPYPPEFKAEAVAMVRSGRPFREVAAALGMNEQSLRNWVKQADLDQGKRQDGLTTEEREELRQLRRENARLRQERDFLKRAAAFFAKETNDR
jgi:transposase